MSRQICVLNPPDLDSDPGDLPSTGRVDGGLKIGLKLTLLHVYRYMGGPEKIDRRV